MFTDKLNVCDSGRATASNACWKTFEPVRSVFTDMLSDKTSSLAINEKLKGVSKERCGKSGKACGRSERS